MVKEVARRRRQPAPAIYWRQTRRRRSAGSADSFRRGNCVSMAAGKDPIDQRLVLLHELAHWLGKPDEGHSLDFWVRAWKLFRRYRVPMHYALAREGEYEGALVGYRKLMKQSRNGHRPR
jgi:hypothetical protein